MQNLALFLLFVTLSTVGCGPAIEREDLGKVETKVPKLPGSEIPFPMPELEPPADKDPQSSPSSAGPATLPAEEPGIEPKKKK